MAESVFGEAVCRELAVDVGSLLVGALFGKSAALCHKALYDSVEGEPVVKAAFYEVFKILAGARSVLGVQSDREGLALIDLDAGSLGFA